MAAADSVRNEMALVDASGMVVWANRAWLRAAGAGPGEALAGAIAGVNLIDLLERAPGADVGSIAAGIAEVARGHAPAFEGKLMSSDGSSHWLITASPAISPSPGAMIIRTDISSYVRGLLAAPPDPDDLAERIEHLTPRETETLRLMVRGLDNRQISNELEISYTTVRSHTQSLMEKLGARSRLQAVVRAHRAGIGR